MFAKVFDLIVSLRFGLVPCILAIHDIAAGEEIFVLYGYDLDYCPDWYMEAWDKGDIHSYCHVQGELDGQRNHKPFLLTAGYN